MPYPAYMEESIHKVAATRPSRLEETFSRIPQAEREGLVNEFHPDYKKEYLRELKIGPNKGIIWQEHWRNGP
ncbi:unnamed protein product [marine sediment metagenome]|uniref:Uncharacterized protein n=1 Tax=marine sediment metagenome TaxID=412755 RepID=X1LJU7_9ZZZZ